MRPFRRQRICRSPQADAASVVDYLRDPKNSAGLRVDPKRIAILGHSFGGWVAALTAAQDHGLIGVALVSAFDVGKDLPRDKIVETLSDATFTLAGVSPEILVDEKASHPDEFQLVKTAPELIDRSVLILTSDDKLADHVSPLIKAIRDRGGKLLAVNHVATDHSWSDHRIALETLILNWLAALP